MEWRILQTGGNVMILILIFMIIQRVECHPYKWPLNFQTENTSSISHVPSLSSIVSFSESGNEFVGSTALKRRIPRATESKQSDNNEGKVKDSSVVSEDMDGETERVLEEAFRTSSDASDIPKDEPMISSADEMTLRRYDLKHGKRAGSLVPYNFADRIVFPDNVEMTRGRNFQKAPVCRRGTLCEDTPFYPTEMVNRAVRSATNLKYLQIRDELEQNVALRNSGQDEVLCEAKKQLVRPRVAMNKNNEWRYIVNTDNFTQAIGVEICENDKGACKLVDGFAGGYKTTCKQNYIYRELVAVVADSSISSEMFQIPASCCCHVQFVGDPTLRMGINLRKSKL